MKVHVYVVGGVKLVSITVGADPMWPDEITESFTMGLTFTPSEAAELRDALEKATEAVEGGEEFTKTMEVT